MRIFKLMFLFLIAGSLTGQKARVSKRWLQQQDSTRQSEVLRSATPVGSLLERGSSLHVMPMSFVNVLSRFRFGGQLKRGRWSYLLDLEIGNDFTQEWAASQNDRNFHFYGLRPEIRYDLDEYQTGFYVGLELPVTVMNRTISGSFNSARSTRRRVEEARQDRIRTSAIAKIGIQFLAGNHVLFDFYIGGGAGYRDVRYTERVGEVADPPEEFEILLFADLPREGGEWVPELAAGFRVGWWF